MHLRFEWNARKALSNERKHGISFEEAQSVFYDENARLTRDDEHSQGEERFVILGMSAGLRLLVVVHCFRESAEVIRLISARGATKRERHQYMERVR